MMERKEIETQRRVLENIFCPIRLHICLGLEQPLKFKHKHCHYHQSHHVFYVCVFSGPVYAFIVNVFFFVVKQMNSRATSDGWKLLDPRNHKKPFGSRFVPLLSSYDIGEWASYDLRKYIDTKFQVLQSNFVVLRLLDKKALKKHLACGNHTHRSGIGLNLWQAKVLRSGRSECSELARVDVAPISTDFEKEMWCSSLCQLPASENRLILEFTDSRLVHVLYHSWALPISVNGRPTTFANTSTQNSKFFSPFSSFFDSSTKKLWKSTLRAKTTHTVLGLA